MLRSLVLSPCPVLGRGLSPRWVVKVQSDRSARHLRRPWPALWALGLARPLLLVRAHRSLLCLPRWGTPCACSSPQGRSRGEWTAWSLRVQAHADLGRARQDVFASAAGVRGCPQGSPGSLSRVLGVLTWHSAGATQPMALRPVLGGPGSHGSPRVSVLRLPAGRWLQPAPHSLSPTCGQACCPSGRLSPNLSQPSLEWFPASWKLVTQNTGCDGNKPRPPTHTGSHVWVALYPLRVLGHTVRGCAFDPRPPSGDLQGGRLWGPPPRGLPICPLVGLDAPDPHTA